MFEGTTVHVEGGWGEELAKASAPLDRPGVSWRGNRLGPGTDHLGCHAPRASIVAGSSSPPRTICVGKELLSRDGGRGASGERELPADMGSYALLRAAVCHVSRSKPLFVHSLVVGLARETRAEDTLRRGSANDAFCQDKFTYAEPWMVCSDLLRREDPGSTLRNLGHHDVAPAFPLQHAAIRGIASLAPQE